MNKVLLTGRLTRDMEMYYPQTQGGVITGKFTLAVDRKNKSENGPTADFIGCTAFGKTAQNMEKYLRKGSKIEIEGRIVTSSYVKQSKRIYTTDVVVDNFGFLDSKRESNQREEERNARAAGHRPSPDGFVNIPDGIDEELPFN